MTQIREATQESVTAAEKTELVFCILHQTMVKAEESACGVRHPEGSWKEEVEFCYFPFGFAYCAPPEAVDGDWAAQDASPEEQEQAELEEVGFWLGGAE